MLINSIELKNLLSFGPGSEPLALRPLNIVIGPNGSGKSNLLEAFALLKAAPGQLNAPIREGGGVRDWLWKGNGPALPQANLEIVTPPLLKSSHASLRYSVTFTESGNRFEIVDERLENAEASPGNSDPEFFYRYENNHPVANVKSEEGFRLNRILRREDVDPEKSILAQRKDPDSYPEITRLGEKLSQIRIYRDWSFGRYAPPRMPQSTDLPNNYLEESARNLAHVLSRLRRDYQTKTQLVESFRAIYAEAVDFDVTLEGGTVQLFVQEESFNVPATRLSDGTLRYLSLLAILYDPNPPPFVCIDEPELGLHPDLISHLVDGLRYARQHTQLVITTHSDALVDHFTEEPEVVLVCEKADGCTHLRRLDGEHLRPWLEKYRLGALWTSGEIGGNRW